MNRKKILIIEDDVDLLGSIKTLLQEAGYEVFAASNGESGISLANSKYPDLIVSDIMMPGVSGYEVLKELSNNKLTRSIPFVFLTAKVERSDVRIGMELGADDYLPKPFEASDLLNTIKIRIEKHESRKVDLVDEKNKLDEDEEIKKYDYDEKIVVEANGKSVIVEIKNIKLISVGDHYTILTIENGKPLIVRRSISSWEESLPANIFIRVHRNALVNINYVIQFEKMPNSTMILHIKNMDKPLSISRRYATLLRDKMDFVS